ncbi:MAG TPA: beta-propeller domain-containing protein [Allosphingosinicella sp.]|nr:beta-propeller domain-containing protein [Allosphingosinicella sp.]
MSRLYSLIAMPFVGFPLSWRLRLAALATALVLPVALISVGLAGQSVASPGPRADSGHALTAFRSDTELAAFLRDLRKREQRQEAHFAMSDAAPPPPPPPPPPPAVAAAPAEQAIAVTGTRVTSSNSITNNQEAGVDEGDIVKLHGDILVILRRGRIFTVSLAGGGMRPIDSIDAFPPGVNAQGDWYDEMLLSGDRVVVVGYSYSRGGTEINRFHLDDQGHLRFEDAYDMRSNDYYSSRNYASRLIGNKLIFYTPLYLGWQGNPLDALPGIRRWRGDASERRFTPIATARQVYIPPVLRDRPEARIDTLHSVTTCDLAAPVMDCTAIGVLGLASRTFYVAQDAVYLWLSDAWSEAAAWRGASAFIYRLPFGNEPPSALGARGAPIDQFYIREDSDGVLNVLVRADGGGDAMWRPEVSAGDVALLRVPVAAFGNGSREAAMRLYRPLPTPRGENWSFQNRFVGAYVLYGGGAFGGRPDQSFLYAAALRGDPPIRLPVGHQVDRIEPIGRDAMVIGESPSGLGFTTVELTPHVWPRLGDVYVQPNSAQGETRSHAFFFNPDPATPDGESGLLGLPVARPAEPAMSRFFGSSAALLYLRRSGRALAPAGELEARPEGNADDGCRASCVDWYGNARPIFVGRRVFALLGYELVEGRLGGNFRIREVGRTSFMPGRRAWRG